MQLRTKERGASRFAQVMALTTYSLRNRERSLTDVNATLTVFLTALIVQYSSKAQQPIRAMAVLSRHLHMR